MNFNRNGFCVISDTNHAYIKAEISSRKEKMGETITSDTHYFHCVKIIPQMKYCTISSELKLDKKDTLY